MKNIKMRYSTEPRDGIYVKGHGLLSFPKNMGKNLNNKYGQKLLDSEKKKNCMKKSKSKNSKSNRWSDW